MLKIVSKRHNERVFDQIGELDIRTARGIRQGFFQLGNELVRELRQETLKKNKRGRIYLSRDRGGRRRRHQASAAGQTPASRTGNYRKNVGYQIRGAQQLEFGVKDGAKYAGFLENGTRFMKPRPGVGNAVKAKARDARTLFEGNMEAQLNQL